MAKFLNELARETLTTKRDILNLAIYLGMERPLQVVNTVYANYPRDIGFVGKDVLRKWFSADMAEPSVKVMKLQLAYMKLHKSGTFQTGKSQNCNALSFSLSSASSSFVAVSSDVRRKLQNAQVSRVCLH